ARDPHLPVRERDAIDEDIDVIVLGAGFGGILSSYHLARAGVTSFRNIDTAGDWGGVWYWNRYPGIQCDNDAYCYLPLLEETGYMPSQKFADGAEIYQYCKHMAEKFGFADRALFHTHAKELRWDETLKRWCIATNRGDTIRARFVVVASGVLNMPKLPGIPGIDKFKGKMFHTARWDYDYTGGSYGNPVLDRLADKKVAIVGTGATAIQAVPYLGRHAGHLYVLQRTPSNVDERPNPKTDPDWAASLRPGWQQERQANFHRAVTAWFQPGEVDQICDIWTEITRNIHAEFAAEGKDSFTPEEFYARREVMDFRVMERMRRRVESLVKDPETAEKLKPWFNFMCKRPLSNDEYYPTFNRPNVSVIDVSDTQGVEALTEKGFIHEGREYEVDCIIFASGFEVTSDLERRWGFDVVEGRGGRSIYDHWRDGPLTLHGTMTHGFPNQFYVGYIQGATNSSVTLQFGEQGRHIAYVIAETLKRGASVVEPTREAMDAYVARFHEIEIDQSVFLDQCTPSYFNNEGEKNTRWALFRAWGLGWDHFDAMLDEWRSDGRMEGLKLES
ncbi:MAG TPA: NAD(P)/FAD-dependent oxidoreductase, partial [Novosphingobium sp.]|nr:NAD(P)/FAD-dependent oxidoreductase [Novosphingobium sp.]